MIRSKSPSTVAEKKKIRSLPETENFYKTVCKYNLQGPAHKAALKVFLRLSEKKNKQEESKKDKKNRD